MRLFFFFFRRLCFQGDWISSSATTMVAVWLCGFFTNLTTLALPLQYPLPLCDFNSKVSNANWGFTPSFEGSLHNEERIVDCGVFARAFGGYVIVISRRSTDKGLSQGSPALLLSRSCL